MKYTVDLIPISKNKRPGTKVTMQYLTIHSTGNANSTAKNERGWLTNTSNTRTASWHICVDENEAIEAIPTGLKLFSGLPAEVAWHAGDTKGNNTSIGLEICESGDRAKTIANAIEVTAKILLEKGWTTANLKQHYDWSGKNCPAILRTGNKWQEFVKGVDAKLKELKVKNTTSKGVSDHIGHWAEDAIEEVIKLGIMSLDSTGNFNCSKPVTRAEMACIISRILKQK